MKKALQRGFSLIEMLVVLAITAVLLGIIIIPMIQSFNFARAAEGLAEEQEKGRELIDQVSRDIASGTAVGDNEGTNGEIVIQVPYTNPTTHVAAIYDIPIYNSRIDIYKAARSTQVAPLVTGGGTQTFYNNNSGHFDPTLGANNGQPVVPATSGETVVRYFVGLRQPLGTSTGGTPTPGQYNNPYDGLLMPINGLQDNLFVLYRAEVQPYANGTYNSALFKQDPKNPGAPYLADPYFFTLSANDPNLAANGGVAGQAGRISQWLSKATIVSDNSRSDMILPLYNLNDRSVYTYTTTYNGVPNTSLPKIVSLIQFRPSPVAQESATGQTALAFGNETTSISKVFTGSDSLSYVNPELGISSNVLRTTKGAWNSAVVSVFPYPTLNSSPPYAPTVSPSANDYLTMDLRSGAMVFGTAGINSTSPTTVFPDTWPATQQNLLLFNGVVSPNNTVPAGEVLFDLNQYGTSTAANTSTSARYPFSEAIAAAEAEDPSGSDWLTLFQGSLAPARNEFIPFDYDSHSGQVETSFNIREFGNPAATTKNIDNSPMVPTSGFSDDGPAYSSAGLIPVNDSRAQTLAQSGGTFYDAHFASINERFNLEYYLYPTIRPILQRFIDLRVEPEGDGWCSPMDLDPGDDSPLAYILNEFPCGSPPPTPPNPPNYAAAKTRWATNWIGFENVTIVPSSEVIIGPDQINGGAMTRYTRVTANPGPNQYVINYSNLAEPSDYTQLASGLTNPAGTYDYTLKSFPNSGYDPHNLTSAVIEPRFKMGYIQLDSDPNTVLPPGYFHVTYQLQFNRPADSIAVNYDSREVLNVLLTMRSYPQASNIPNPQTITLQASAPVKNFIR